MRLQAVAVVVPARDEQDTVAACLGSIAIAARQISLHVLTVVVADHCRDDTAARSAAAGATVAVRWGPPQGAWALHRCHRYTHALHQLGGLPDGLIWLAHTDADSQVPPDWLSAQLALAGRGHDPVAGMVRLTGTGNRDARRLWTASYRQRHGHVHGANLGVRADAYLAVGGFQPVPAHEDLLLVRDLIAGGYSVARPRQPRVVTSSRLTGRTPAGVAADLRKLG